MKRLYKAINEGLKLSLIDFGNNKILKSSHIDNRLISEQDIDDWLESGADMPEDLYKELCKDKYIGLYEVKDNGLLRDIFCRIKFKDINLNWLDISHIGNFRFGGKRQGFNFYTMDISHLAIDVIPNRAFSQCEDLKLIKLPYGITSIKLDAFSYCKYLGEIDIPGSVKTIEKHAFYYCSNLYRITCQEGVTTIEENAFEECSNLQEINIPNSIMYIGKNAFKTNIGEDYKPYVYINYNGNWKLWKKVSKAYAFRTIESRVNYLIDI